MISSNGKQSFVREGYRATLLRNCSFIEIWFKRKDRTRAEWIRIPVSDLERILSKTEDSSGVKSSVEFDTPI